MSIFIQKPGILTTVQDLGRYKYRRFGINPSGVMDETAARLINILVNNDDNEAVLEMHFPAPRIVFETDAIVAIGGGEFSPTLDDKPVDNWRSFFANKNSVLEFTKRTSGNRAYLTIKGGLKTDEWLGSSSTNLTARLGGCEGRKLQPGERIAFKQKPKRQNTEINLQLSAGIIPRYSHFPTVRVIPGAEFEHLSGVGRGAFFDQDFTISNSSNRMGFRLAGEPVPVTKSHDLVSSAVSFGTIQLLPDGQLIVLMADHQTAGGYPRIAHVVTRDLPLLAQLGANDKVAFYLVETRQAEELALEFERELNFLKVGVQFDHNF